MTEKKELRLKIGPAFGEAITEVMVKLVPSMPKLQWRISASGVLEGMASSFDHVTPSGVKDAVLLWTKFLDLRTIEKPAAGTIEYEGELTEGGRKVMVWGIADRDAFYDKADQ